MEFDTVDFEKRLTGLKDTQDSIQSMSSWCLKNRANHKKVVSSWLNVLKQVKVEHRLILFYLANDVIQHSKRKNFEFVDSWGTTLQRATTMVRDDKVKAKIIRIFSIWEQRDIYNDEFLADLRDLLNINPAKRQPAVAVEPDDDQHLTLVTANIRACVRLEADTDRALKIASNKPPQMYDADGIQSLKDRRHVEEVEHQLGTHKTHVEACIRALEAETKARRQLIVVLEQTDAFYHNQRGEVKVVANAYRNFNNRVKTTKRKLDELCTTLPSPLPSPDINAPSPEPEDNEFDLELDGKSFDENFLHNSANGFLSGSFGGQNLGKLPFDIADFGRQSSSSHQHSSPQAIQVIGGRSSLSKSTSSSSGSASGGDAAADASSATTAGATGTRDPNSDFNIDDFFKSLLNESQNGGGGGGGQQRQNLPQPVPPVFSSMSSYTTLPTQMGGYPNATNQPSAPAPYNPHSQYGGASSSSTAATVTTAAPYHSQDEYNPESWDHQQQQQQQQDMSWSGSSQSGAGGGETSFNHSHNLSVGSPVSPSLLYGDRSSVRSHTPREYSDTVSGSGGGSGGGVIGSGDVDHRLLRLPICVPLSAISKEKTRALDVDHRNLISLTGSPTPSGKIAGESQLGTSSLAWSLTSNQDTLSIPGLGDTDYRNAAIALAESKLFQPPLPPKMPLLESPPSCKPNPVGFVSDLLGNVADRSPSIGSSSRASQQQQSVSSPLSSGSSSASGGGGGGGGGGGVGSAGPFHQRSLNKHSPLKRPNGQRDNVEAIDMEMSDEDYEENSSYQQQQRQQQADSFATDDRFNEPQRSAPPNAFAMAPPPPFGGQQMPTFTSSTSWRGGGVVGGLNQSRGPPGNVHSSPWMHSNHNDAGDDGNVRGGGGGNHNNNMHGNNGGADDCDDPLPAVSHSAKHVNPFGQPPPQPLMDNAEALHKRLGGGGGGDPSSSWSSNNATVMPQFDNSFDNSVDDNNERTNDGCNNDTNDDDDFGGHNDSGNNSGHNSYAMMNTGGPPRHFMGHGPGGGPWNHNNNNGGDGGGGNRSGPWNNGPGPGGPGGFGGGGPMQMRGGGGGGGGFRGGRGGPNGSPYFRPPGGGMRGGPRPNYRGGGGGNFRGYMRGGGGVGYW